jgi:beta-mannosidase
MKRDFPVPESAKDYVYMSQLLQAYGITKGIEAQRRAKPYNMGTLYWQLNDCWPAVSWSSIDYFGNWKALQYKAKKSFEDVLISSVIEEDILKTYAVNDELSEVPINLKFEILDFDGQTILKDSVTDILEPNESKLIYTLSLSDLKLNRRTSVLVVSEGEKTWIKYFSKPKDLKLKQGDIQTEITKTGDGFRIKLSSETLQKDVFLFTTEKGKFHDNFFDILPNEVMLIYFKTEAGHLDDLQLKTFNNFIR